MDSPTMFRICNSVLKKVFPWILLVMLCVSSTTDRYTLYTTPKSYFDAKSQCTSEGKRMVKICNDFDFQDIINLTIGKSLQFWIGLRLDDTRPPTDTSYRHEDGEKAEFYRWDSNEPNKQLDDQCIRIKYEGGNAVFKTKYCSQTYDVVCEIFGEENPDFKSAIAEAKEEAELDMSNLCIIQSTNHSSKILCSESCAFMRCNTFGINIVSKTCELFRTKEEPCTPTSYNRDVKYFQVDYGDKCG